MRTTLECLAKASEMEDRASQCAMLFTRSHYLKAAMLWRDLARRALIHDQLGALPVPQEGEDVPKRPESLPG